MYGGENSGMPLGPDPVNNGTGTFSAENDYDQPAAIVSGGDDGGAVAFDSSKSDNNAKFFGHRSREKSVKQAAAPQVDMNLVAASNIANNPNNPEFFRQAAIDNTTAQIQRQPRRISAKPFIILAVILVLVGAVVATIMLWPKEKTLASADTMKKFNEFANYMLTGEVKNTKLGEKEYKDYKAEVMAKEIPSEASKEYYSKAKELFDAFRSAAKADEPLMGNDVFKDHLTNYENYFLAVYNSFHSDEISDSNLIAIYSRNGEVGTMAYIDALFKDKFGDDLDIANYYRREYDKDYVRLLSVLSKHSCINDATVNEVCANSIADSSFKDSIDIMQQDYDLMNGYIGSARGLVSDYIWDLNKALRGKDEE